MKHNQNITIRMLRPASAQDCRYSLSAGGLGGGKHNDAEQESLFFQLLDMVEIAINKYQTQIEEDRLSLHPGLSIRHLQ